uniref:GNAT family N-acetyltransferase n=1 Tax=Aerococcus urinaeequi TaxID=51665 RepID=UPI00242E4C14|nr:GNAT family N-acetyltransferase [Aerococcus urinaeequi]
MIKIRPIAKEDEPVIATIIRSVLEENHLDVRGTAYFDPQLDYMYDYYQKLVDSAYWVVEDQGCLVGGVGIALLSESLDFPIKGHPELLTEKGEIIAKVGELQKLYLLPEARGKGYSRRLMDTVTVFAVERGYDFLYLETISRLKTAIILYEKWDYRFLDEPLLPGDHILMDTFMIKDLNAK